MDDHGWLLLPRLDHDPIPIESLRVDQYAINQLYQCTVQWYSSVIISPKAWLGQPAVLRLINQNDQTMYLHGLTQQLTVTKMQHQSLVKLILVTPLSELNYFNHAVWGTQSYQHWLIDCVKGCSTLQLISHIPPTDTFQFLAMHNENFLNFMLASLAQQNYQYTFLQTPTCAQWVVAPHPFPSTEPTTIIAQPLETHYHRDDIQLIVTTEAVNVFPGQSIQLALHPALSQTMIQHVWQIRHLKIFYQRDHIQPLQTQLTLTHRPSRWVKKTRFTSSPVLEALVADSQTTHAHLDSQGRYALFFPYTQQTIDQPRFDLAQPYHGDQRGFHSPLTPNSRVWIGFLEDDRQQPFILGTLTDAHHPSSVTAANAHTSQWRSIEGHRWRINNRSDQAEMQWSTANERVQLHLQETYHQSGIYGLARQASVIFQIGQNCQWTVERALKWHAQHNVHFTIHQHLKFHSEKNLQWAAKHHLQLRAQDSLSFKTDSLSASTHHSYWKSNQNLSFQGSEQIDLSAKSMTWQAGRAIHCTGHEEILIRHGLAQIHISRTGRMTFTASTIHIHSKLA